MVIGVASVSVSTFVTGVIDVPFLLFIIIILFAGLFFLFLFLTRSLLLPASMQIPINLGRFIPLWGVAGCVVPTWVIAIATTNIWSDTRVLDGGVCIGIGTRDM
jgi:hypothetical protein